MRSFSLLDFVRTHRRTLIVIVGIALIAQVTGTHVEQCALVTPHQFFICPGNMEQLDMSALHQLFIRELARVIPSRKRLGLVQNDSCQSGK